MDILLDKSFSWYWKRSLITHALIIVMIIINNKFDFFKFNSNEPTKIMSSVRIDIVELPKYTLEELKQLEVAPPPTSTKLDKPQTAAAEVKTEKSVFEEIVKKSEKKLADKKIDELKKINENRATEDRREEMKQLLLAGNKVQQGVQVQGEEHNQVLTEFDKYVLEVTEKVRYQWKLPSYLKDATLKCRIQVFINSKGMLEMAKVVESSGNEEYDNWALRSINDALPFKIPSNIVLPELLRGRFILGYPL